MAHVSINGGYEPALPRGGRTSTFRLPLCGRGAPQDQQYSAAATASSSTFVYRGHCAFVLAVAVSAEIDSKVGCKGGAGNRHCNVRACDRNFCVVPTMVIGMCFEFANKQINISINRRPPGNCLEKSLRIGAHTHAHARKHIHTYANIRKHTQTRVLQYKGVCARAHPCCWRIKGARCPYQIPS